MLNMKNYDEANNLLTELTSEEAVDVNGGGFWGGVIGAGVGFLLAGPVGAEAGALVGYMIGENL